jgi:hypothetical protein
MENILVAWQARNNALRHQEQQQREGQETRATASFSKENDDEAPRQRNEDTGEEKTAGDDEKLKAAMVGGTADDDEQDNHLAPRSPPPSPTPCFATLSMYPFPPYDPSRGSLEGISTDGRAERDTELAEADPTPQGAEAPTTQDSEGEMPVLIGRDPDGDVTMEDLFDEQLQDELLRAGIEQEAGETDMDCNDVNDGAVALPEPSTPRVRKIQRRGENGNNMIVKLRYGPFELIHGPSPLREVWLASEIPDESTREEALRMEKRDEKKASVAAWLLSGPLKGN